MTAFLCFFSLDGFLEEENQDEKITEVLDEWIQDMVDSTDRAYTNNINSGHNDC